MQHTSSALINMFHGKRVPTPLTRNIKKIKLNLKKIKIKIFFEN